MTKAINTLIKELKTRRFIFGPRVAMKKLNKDEDEIEKIYFSSDFPIEKTRGILKKIKEKKKKEVEIEIINLKLTKEELKETCKKPFNISIISILKEKNENKNQEIKKQAKQKTKKTTQKETRKKTRANKKQIKKK